MSGEREKGAGAATDGACAVVGKSKPRLDGRDKVTGRLKYLGDVEYAGILHGAVLRSPYPHALIKRIDVSRAAGLPGVVTVMTADDIPGRNGFGAITPDQPVICKEKVRFVGDGVALVAAVDEKTAIKALGLIDVAYEQLPAVFSPVEALRSGAPKVHESGKPYYHLPGRKGRRGGGVRRGRCHPGADLPGTLPRTRLSGARRDGCGARSRRDDDRVRTHAGPFHYTEKRGPRARHPRQQGQVRGDDARRRLRRQRGFDGGHGRAGGGPRMENREARASRVFPRRDNAFHVQAPSHDTHVQDRGEEGRHLHGLRGDDL